MKRAKRPVHPDAVRISTTIMASWQRAVLQYARKPRGVDPREVNAGEMLRLILNQEAGPVRELWEVFTLNRADIPRYLMNPKKQAIGYLLGFHLPNIARMNILLKRVQDRYDLRGLLRSSNKNIWITDLGCGTGALSEAWISYLSALGIAAGRLNVQLVDSVGAYLDIAHFILADMAPEVTRTSSKAKLETVLTRIGRDMDAQEGIQIINLGYIWNELSANPSVRKRLIDFLARITAGRRDIIVAVLEPAIQNIARQAMMLRDALAEEGLLPIYPCPYFGPCPMLERTRDWCYSEGCWDKPQIMEKIDRKLEIDHGVLKAGAYLFVSPSLHKSLTAQAIDPSVVVGRPETVTGRSGGPKAFEYLLCQDDGLQKKRPFRGAPKQLRGEIIKD